MFPATYATPTIFRTEYRCIPEPKQRIGILITYYEDSSSIASIPPIRTTKRLIFLASSTYNTVTTFPTDYMNSYLVNHLDKV